MTAGLGRDEILRRFEALLDSALASEAPPAGIDAEVLSLAMGGRRGRRAALRFLRAEDSHDGPDAGE